MEENRNEELSKEAAETETTETAAEEQAATEDTREAAAEPEEKEMHLPRKRTAKRKASSERKRKIKKTHRLKNLQIGYSGRWQNLTTSANVPKKRRQQCLRLARRA